VSIRSTFCFAASNSVVVGKKLQIGRRVTRKKQIISSIKEGLKERDVRIMNSSMIKLIVISPTACDVWKKEARVFEISRIWNNQLLVMILPRAIVAFKMGIRNKKIM
jgi:hypothetical protein